MNPIENRGSARPMALRGPMAAEQIRLPAATDSVEPDGAAEQSAKAQRRDLYRSAVEFESLLVQKMLQSMRTATKNLAGDSAEPPGRSMYQDMADAEIARAIAAGNRGGLAAQLYRQLSGENPDPDLVASVRRGRAHWPGSSASNTPPVRPPVDRSEAPSRGRLRALIAQAARRHGVPPGLAEAVAAQESNWDPAAVSSKGAIGIMQLMPDTARGLGVKNAHDPVENIEAGVSYLASMLERFDDQVPLALAAYNAGPGAVARYGGIPPFEETRNYVSRIMDTWNPSTPLSTLGEKRR